MNNYSKYYNYTYSYMNIKYKYYYNCKYLSNKKGIL